MHEQVRVQRHRLGTQCQQTLLGLLVLDHGCEDADDGQRSSEQRDAALEEHRIPDAEDRGIRHGVYVERHQPRRAEERAHRLQVLFQDTRQRGA